MKRILAACSVVVALSTAGYGQVPAGGQFRINTYTTGGQGGGRVAMEPDGNFVFVWYAAGPDGDVFGQRFDASGAPRGGEFMINAFTPGAQRHPAIVVGSGGLQS